jgi:hypothetical protein
MYINKRIVLLVSAISMTVGSAVPLLFSGGDMTDMMGWSILGGMVGGLLGIWLGVWIGKRLG